MYRVSIQAGTPFGVVAEVRVLLLRLAVMILDAVVLRDLLTDHFDHFVAHVWAMQAGRVRE